VILPVLPLRVRKWYKQTDQINSASATRIAGGNKFDSYYQNGLKSFLMTVTAFFKGSTITISALSALLGLSGNSSSPDAALILKTLPEN
jgi:hypothetical protein